MFAFFKDISRIEGAMGIAFTATKHEVHSNIKPGTSASSVSSYGSLGQRVSYIKKILLYICGGNKKIYIDVHNYHYLQHFRFM